MEDRRELYCLVSINSSLFDESLIRLYSCWAEDHDARIRYVILDHPERHNLHVFESLSEEEAGYLAGAHAQSCQIKLGLSDADVIPWPDICDRIHFKSAMEKVLDFYQTNRSFKAHCLSQTFSNLQPKFRAIGVRKKSDEKVQQSVLYLLEELAIKTGAFESGEFFGEILPREEMDLVKEIYAGTYFSCSVSERGFRIIWLANAGGSQIEYTCMSPTN